MYTNIKRIREIAKMDRVAFNTNMSGISRNGNNMHRAVPLFDGFFF